MSDGVLSTRSEQGDIPGQRGSRSLNQDASISSATHQAMTYFGGISIFNIPTSIITKIPIFGYLSVCLREEVSRWKEDLLRKRSLEGKWEEERGDSGKRKVERGKREERRGKGEGGKRKEERGKRKKETYDNDTHTSPHNFDNY